MQLGWIDFSKEERDKVLNVIHLLEEPGAVDELGIGIIRDGFANYFFPGTSTVQTRAKYFLIVPYVLKEAGDGKYGDDVRKIMARIDKEEMECGKKLKERHGSNQGVIGERVLPNRWVARKPSNIYWSGIREFGIFRNEYLSIREYIEQSVHLREEKNNKSLGNRKDKAEENEKDDRDAGDLTSLQFWNLPKIEENWKENLSLELTPGESKFLKERIIREHPDSLFALILKNNTLMKKLNEEDEIKDFETLTTAVNDEVASELKEMLKLANDFNKLVYMARIRYNVMLFQRLNEKANKEWAYYEPIIKEMTDVDLEKIYAKFSITRRDLKIFLNELQKAFQEGDYDRADVWIRKREKSLKGESRAKLCRCDEYVDKTWVGGEWLDFRFNAAKRIINDIYEGEAKVNV